MAYEQLPDGLNYEPEEAMHSASKRRMSKTGAAVIAGCLIAAGGGAKLATIAAENRAHAELASGEVSATRDLIEPIDFTCSAWSKWSVEAKYDYQLYIAKKRIPGFSATATFEKPTAVMLQYCMKDSVDTEVVSENGKTLVKVPIDNMYLNAQIPTGNERLDFTTGSGLKTVGGGASILSGVGGLGCSVVSLGKKNEECSKVADKIDNFKRDFDSNKSANARDQLIESTRKNASKEDWEDVKNIYRDKTKDAAVKQAGGDRSAADKVDAIFVDKNGNETKEIPEFKDIFEELRKNGDLEIPDVDVKKTKFTAKKNGTSYKPQYFDPRQEGVTNEQ